MSADDTKTMSTSDPQESTPSNLTHRQRLFIDYYLTSFNASDSARKAGYTGKFANRMGSQNLQNPYIKAEIESRLKLVKGDEEITPDWIRRKIKDTIEDCKTPKDKFIGLELLGRATVNTFNDGKTDTAPLNIFNIIGAPSGVVPIQRKKAAALDLAPVKAIVTPSPAQVTPVEVMPVQENDGNNINSGNEAIPPQATTSDNNTPSPKILPQFPSSNTCYPSENGIAEVDVVPETAKDSPERGT